jgi:hypothetical protein
MMAGWSEKASSCASTMGSMAAPKHPVCWVGLCWRRGAGSSTLHVRHSTSSASSGSRPNQWAYNEGRSTQVPVNPAAPVTGRFVRRLKYQDTEVRLER